jgi:cytochrome c6
MLRKIAGLILLLAASTGFMSGCSKTDEKQKANVAPAGFVPVVREQVRDGEALFRQYCAVCHPDGGNVSDPERTLRGSVLKRNHITTPEDVVRVVRTPLSRMIRFDVTTLSDGDARAIAEYVLKTFK